MISWALAAKKRTKPVNRATKHAQVKHEAFVELARREGSGSVLCIRMRACVPSRKHVPTGCFSAVPAFYSDARTLLAFQREHSCSMLHLKRALQAGVHGDLADLPVAGRGVQLARLADQRLHPVRHDLLVGLQEAGDAFPRL